MFSTQDLVIGRAHCYIYPLEMWDIRVIPLCLGTGCREYRFNVFEVYGMGLPPIMNDSAIGKIFFVKCNHGRRCNFSVKRRDKGVHAMDIGPNGF